jgi:hypothetical protein
MFVIYRLELLVRVQFVSIVYTLAVACFFGFVSLLILAVALYIFFYVPKAARDECPPFRFKASLFLIGLARHFNPPDLASFYSKGKT